MKIRNTQTVCRAISLRRLNPIIQHQPSRRRHAAERRHMTRGDATTRASPALSLLFGCASPHWFSCTSARVSPVSALPPLACSRTYVPHQEVREAGSTVSSMPRVSSPPGGVFPGTSDVALGSAFPHCHSRFSRPVEGRNHDRSRSVCLSPASARNRFRPTRARRSFRAVSPWHLLCSHNCTPIRLRISSHPTHFLLAPVLPPPPPGSWQGTTASPEIHVMTAPVRLVPVLTPPT